MNLWHQPLLWLSQRSIDKRTWPLAETLNGVIVMGVPTAIYSGDQKMKKLIKKYGKVKVIVSGAVLVVVLGLMLAHGVPVIELNQ